MTIYSICLHCGNLIGRKERRYCPHCDTEEKRQRQVEEQAEIKVLATPDNALSGGH